MDAMTKNWPSAIYVFGITVAAKDTDQGVKKVLPIVEQCEHFADALHISFRADHVGAFDGKLWVRLMFNVKKPQNRILHDVATLFSFAAALKLEFVNQIFFPEKKS